jgi:N,N'-diacetylchitobiose transport system permease protein
MSVSEIDAGGANRTGSRLRRWTRGNGTPYALALPTIFVILLVFGYPFAYMIYLSFHNLTAADLYQDLSPAWAGLDEYRRVLTNHDFLVVTWRTVKFTVATVVISVLLALLIAMLIGRVSRPVKVILSTVLVFVWSVPSLVSIQIFSWLTDPDFSVLNWIFTKFGVHYDKHDWFLNPNQGLAVASAVVIWGAVPFLAITLHAGMTQVPKELLEAATVDGANAWRRFRAVTLPILRPLLVIVTTLSIVWDIQVFLQIWILRHGQPEPTYQTLSIYTYMTAINGTQYSIASAIGVITVILMLVVMVFYIRQIFRIGDND